MIPRSLKAFLEANNLAVGRSDSFALKVSPATRVTLPSSRRTLGSKPGTEPTKFSSLERSGELETEDPRTNENQRTNTSSRNFGP